MLQYTTTNSYLNYKSGIFLKSRWIQSINYPLLLLIILRKFLQRLPRIPYYLFNYYFRKFSPFLSKELLYRCPQEFFYNSYVKTSIEFEIKSSKHIFSKACWRSFNDSAFCQEYFMYLPKNYSEIQDHSLFFQGCLVVFSRDCSKDLLPP